MPEKVLGLNNCYHKILCGDVFLASAILADCQFNRD